MKTTLKHLFREFLYHGAVIATSGFLFFAGWVAIFGAQAPGAIQAVAGDAKDLTVFLVMLAVIQMAPSILVGVISAFLRKSEGLLHILVWIVSAALLLLASVATFRDSPEPIYPPDKAGSPAPY